MEIKRQTLTGHIVKLLPSSVEEGKAEAAKREPDRAKPQYKPRLGW